MKDRIRRWFLSPTGYMLWVALGDLDAWEFTADYYITHKRSRIEIQTSQGAGGFIPRTHQHKGASFGFWEKRILWRRYRELSMAKVMMDLTRLGR